MNTTILQRYNVDKAAFSAFLEHLGYTLKSTGADGNELWNAPDDTPGDTSLTIKQVGADYNVHVFTGKAYPLEQGADYSFSDARMKFEGIDAAELTRRLVNEGYSDDKPKGKQTSSFAVRQAQTSAKPKPEQKKDYQFPYKTRLDEDSLYIEYIKPDLPGVVKQGERLIQDDRMPNVYIGKLTGTDTEGNALIEHFAFRYDTADGSPASLTYRVKSQGKDKDFRQYSFNSDSGTFTFGKVKNKRLFNEQSVQDAHSVFYVEGEKCAYHLYRFFLEHGINGVGVVTSGSSDEFNAGIIREVLGGKSVFVFPDNDAPGFEHAAKVKRALQPTGSAVQVWKWSDDTKEKDDISDFLAKYSERLQVDDLTSFSQSIETLDAGSWTDGAFLSDYEKEEAGAGADDEFTLEGERSPNRRRADEIVPFPIEALPRECQDFILDIAKAQGQDPAPIAAVLLAQLAGTIGGSVRVMAGFNWYIPPVLWLGIIGISGGGKSPILDNVESLLSDVSWEFHKKFKSEEKEYDVKMRRWQKRQKDPTADPTPPPEKPIERKIYTTDATFEGFVKDNLGSGCRTPLLLDELVTFFAMLHRTGTAGEEAKWLAGYNGSGVRTSRTSVSEVYIEHAYWGIWGGSTPEKFRNYLEMGGGDKDGTLSRFCFVWIPDSENDPHTYNAETGEFLADDPVIKEHFRRMKMITETIIKGIPEGTVLRLCPDAMRLWADRVTIYKGRVKGTLGEDTDAECAFISKSTELPIRIAIVIHALKAAQELCEKGKWEREEKPLPAFYELPPIVSLETYKEAESIALWLEGEGFDNYRRFGFLESNEKTERRKILLCIANAGADGISERGIYMKLQQYRTKTGRPKLQKALTELEEQKRISKKDVKPIKGRPTTLYYVSPAE